MSTLLVIADRDVAVAEERAKRAQVEAELNEERASSRERELSE